MSRPQPFSFSRVPAVLLALAASLLQSPASAQEVPPPFAETEAHFLATFGEDERYFVTTLQHFSTWRYGSNFFFVDAAAGDDFEFYDDQFGLYLEYAPVVSLTKTGFLSLGEGSVLRDVGVTAQINGGWTPTGFPIGRVFLEGVELAWGLPGFAVFNTQLLARQESGYDPSWQFTWAFLAPFSIGGAEARVQGFLDLWNREGAEGLEDGLVLLTQPQLLVNIARSPGGGQLMAGVEIQGSYNFPVSTPQPGGYAISPMIRWVF